MSNILAHSVTHISLDKAALSSTNALKDGGFVFVRVLGEKPNGKMLVSFAGSVFEADSKLAGGLKPGDSFKAQLRIANGNVNLVPVKSEAAEALQTAENSQALFASMCNALGLLPDEVSLKLLQFMRENGAYFTKDELQALQKKAKASGAKSAKMAEIMAFLKAKGIEPSDEAVNEILAILDDAGKKKSKNISYAQSEKMTGSFLDLIYANPEAVLKAKKGLLTLSNHLGGENSHWIILPFEKEAAGTVWNGNIRMLLDKSIHSVKKLYINAKNNEKSLIFEFFPPKNMHRVFEIRYAVEPEVSENEVGRFSKILENIFAAEGRSLEIVYDKNLLDEYFVDSGLFIKGVDEEA